MHIYHGFRFLEYVLLENSDFVVTCLLPALSTYYVAGTAPGVSCAINSFSPHYLMKQICEQIVRREHI